MLAAIRSPGAIALIGATAGVFGAVLGSVASGWVLLKIESRRQLFERTLALRREQRNRERELAVVRGVARVWADQVRSYRAMLQTHVSKEHSQWWPEDMYESVQIRIPYEDQKVVAGELADDHWAKVTAAADAVLVVENMRTSDRKLNAIEPEKLGPPLTEFQRTFCEAHISVLDRAADVLEVLSDREPKVDPNDPV